MCRIAGIPFRFVHHSKGARSCRQCPETFSNILCKHPDLLFLAFLISLLISPFSKEFLAFGEKVKSIAFWGS